MESTSTRRANSYVHDKPMNLMTARMNELLTLSFLLFGGLDSGSLGLEAALADIDLDGSVGLLAFCNLSLQLPNLLIQVCQLQS